MTAADIDKQLEGRLRAEGPDVISAYLFGSEAEGGAHGESDVDLAVLLPRDRFPDSALRFEPRLSLSSRLATGLGGRNLDLVVLNDAPPLLARHIVTYGRRLSCTNPEADHAFVRDAQLRAADIEPFVRRMRRIKLERMAGVATFLVDRLAGLHRHLDHLRAVRARVSGTESLQRDLSLRNDVLFSLVTVCHLVIDIAGELATRRGDRFEDYTQAVRSLASDARFPAGLVRRLERLPRFRNVIVHEYVALDLARVMQALDELDHVREFMRIVAGMERGSTDPSA